MRVFGWQFLILGEDIHVAVVGQGEVIWKAVLGWDEDIWVTVLDRGEDIWKAAHNIMIIYIYIY